MGVSTILYGIFVWIVSALMALVVAMLHLLTFGNSREWSRQYLIAPLARFLLKLGNIDLQIKYQITLEQRPYIFISNHTSALDIFAVGALCLNNSYCFLSQSTWFHLPLTALALLSGVFYLPAQSSPQGREAVFKRASDFLKRTAKNIFLTPEGERVTSGSVGSFNKGAFHLALELNRPIVCIYIECRDLKGNRNYSLKGPLICRLTYFEIIPAPNLAPTLEQIICLRDICQKKYQEFENNLVVKNN